MGGYDAPGLVGLAKATADLWGVPVVITAVVVMMLAFWVLKRIFDKD